MKNKIRVFRAMREITQEELATALGVTRQTIIAIEKGKYDPSLPLAFRISRFFNLPVEKVFLFDDTEATGLWDSRRRSECSRPSYIFSAGRTTGTIVMYKLHNVKQALHRRRPLEDWHRGGRHGTASPGIEFRRRARRRARCRARGDRADRIPAQPCRDLERRATREPDQHAGAAKRDSISSSTSRTYRSR